MFGDKTRCFDGLLHSWLIALDAEGRAAKTLDCYRLGVVQLARWLLEHDHADDVQAVTTAQLRDWMRGMREAGASDNTVRNRYNGARLFLAWCVSEGELAANPMDPVGPPKVHEKVTRMLTPDQLRTLVDSVEGPTFTHRRDTALVLLFADTGCRLSELANLRVDDVDLQTRSIDVVGKGSRPRTVAFGARTAKALDRYLRARRREARSDTSYLWLGSTGKGRMFADGIRQLMNRRGEAIGVRLHPHMFRHGFADAFLAAGGQEGDLMAIAGWESRQMLNRYGAGRRAERAREAHRKLSPMDHL